MKFTRIVFTHPITIGFTQEDGRPRDGFSNSLGTLCTYPNATSTPVDSIEAAGHWVLIKFKGQTKAVPAAKIDCVDVLDDAPAKGKSSAAA